jgi:18S rRNA (adenine1779-N6/adenine1780-N6)-dimethyltransferase
MPVSLRGANQRSAGAQARLAAAANPIQRQLPLQKKFGQHLLRNPGILDKIIESGDIKSSDIVFEIGPGTGNLTMRMLAQGKTVIAQEIDPRMAAEVRK